MATHNSTSTVRIFEISNRIVTSVFDSKRAQLFQIFEYLPSPISYVFDKMTPIFHLSNHAYQPLSRPPTTIRFDSVENEKKNNICTALNSTHHFTVLTNAVTMDSV